jgi:hypothetical protein
MRQGPRERSQAAVQAVREQTPSPGRSRIGELRIRTEEDSIEEAAFARIVPTYASMPRWTADKAAASDAREGVAAFVEKRSPRYLGR